LEKADNSNVEAKRCTAPLVFYKLWVLIVYTRLSVPPDKEKLNISIYIQTFRFMIWKQLEFGPQIDVVSNSI